MEAVFPIAALSERQQEVKEAAMKVVLPTN